MGGTLHTAGRAAIMLSIHAIASPGSRVHLLLDGEEATTPLPLEGSAAKATLTAPAGRHYLRLEVRDDGGTSELISSPLYINFPEE
jgi:hypothetical protein